MTVRRLANDNDLDMTLYLGQSSTDTILFASHVSAALRNFQLPAGKPSLLPEHRLIQWLKNWHMIGEEKGNAIVP